MVELRIRKLIGAQQKRMLAALTEARAKFDHQGDSTVLVSSRRFGSSLRATCRVASWSASTLGKHRARRGACVIFR